MANYFKEIATYLAGKQKDLVDAITQNSPELSVLPMSPSSHGDWDITPVVKNVTGGSFVEFNASLPKMSVNADIEKVALKVLGGEIFCPQDTARQYENGAMEYFARMSMPLLRRSAQTVGNDILVNSFRQYAIDNGNIVKAATSGDNFSSIIAVTFVEGEIEGVYNPNYWNGEGIFKIENLNNGALMKDVDTKVNGYAQQLKTIMGIKLLNPNKVSAYVNINESNKPTASGVDELLERAEAGTGQKTILFMHPRVYVYLKSLKNNAITDFSGDANIFKGFSAWDNAPIITTYNLPKLTESLVV
jgi:hypothetical protein